MRSKIGYGILLVILIAALIVLFPMFPVWFGFWGIIGTIGLLLMVVGTAAFLLFLFLPLWIWLRFVRWGLLAGGLVLLLALIVGISSRLIPTGNGIVINPTNKIVTTNPTNTDKIAPTATSGNIAPIVNNGINIGSKEKYLVETGDVVVGDISVVNTDGTREALYDNDPGTALVTIFKQNTWIYAEWGCFISKQATQSETDRLIADKKQAVENYNGVIVINWPSN